MYCNYCGKVIQDDAATAHTAASESGARYRAGVWCVLVATARLLESVPVSPNTLISMSTLVRLVWLITAVMTGIGCAFVSDRLGGDAGRAVAGSRRRRGTRLRFRNLYMHVGRTLLSDVFDFGFDSDFVPSIRVKVKSVGQECPTHTTTTGHDPHQEWRRGDCIPGAGDRTAASTAPSVSRPS